MSLFMGPPVIVPSACDCCCPNTVAARDGASRTFMREMISVVSTLSPMENLYVVGGGMGVVTGGGVPGTGSEEAGDDDALFTGGESEDVVTSPVDIELLPHSSL